MALTIEERAGQAQYAREVRDKWEAVAAALEAGLPGPATLALQAAAEASAKAGVAIAYKLGD